MHACQKWLGNNLVVIRPWLALSSRLSFIEKLCHVCVRSFWSTTTTPNQLRAWIVYLKSKHFDSRSDRFRFASTSNKRTLASGASCKSMQVNNWYKTSTGAAYSLRVTTTCNASATLGVFHARHTLTRVKQAKNGRSHLIIWARYRRVMDAWRTRERQVSNARLLVKNEHVHCFSLARVFFLNLCIYTSEFSTFADMGHFSEYHYWDRRPQKQTCSGGGYH